MSESPLQRRLATTTLLISAGTVLGIGALVFGTAVIIGLNVPGVPAHLDLLIIAAMLVQSVGTLIALAFVLRRRGHRISAIGFSRPTGRLFHLLWQIPAAVIVVLGTQLIVFAVTGSEPVSDSSTDSIAGSVGPVAAISMFAAVAIITPLWEELFFRGVIYGYVRDRLGLKGAIPISAVVFALCHGVPILLPYMLALGLCLALLRTFHGNLWGPLGLHVAINSTASLVLLQVAFT
ncbi:MAG: CPBP family intramembrane metalloprotease [Brevibacterium sp.]|nr:CPBP family intramembrane metalloprotease [Brevibacterium sp.]MDN5876879.1 CPBP family intramembrane metalloprotease [Brevibacterium sp.]MDN6189607.1 CPBP family intramembrane metalloprotease [Brevibacterium sp.]MDN6192652.1 CPBP family intramembrane metalloprotease [Brevibacterium sp.]MDN6527783.1 CPBP family intramembrane metalloprotease [Brevibacterium sp.]